MSKLHAKLSLCSTALGHQMSILGGTSYISVHFIWKVDLILLLATRCHYQGVHLISVCSDLKIGAHFEIYSCFTEVFSTKDQWTWENILPVFLSWKVTYMSGTSKKYKKINITNYTLYPTSICGSFGSFKPKILRERAVAETVKRLR